MKRAMTFILAMVAAAAAFSQDADQSSAAVPREWRGIALGMGMEEVKAALAKDSLYFYRGEPDVSLLPRPNESIIEVAGLSYVQRAFFQFYEGKLFVMIFAMDESKMDHYSLFTTLSAKYGKPDTLSPSESVWTDGTTRLSLERPLAVKYMDIAVFEAILAAGQEERSVEDVLRSDFLGSF
ncbi:MAG: hypothetical protein KBB32_10185 [Spirochaetia bacterium]|nr:hypothetical protein [Spirochaetia bacterium]